MNSYAYTDYHHHQFDRPFLSPLPMPSPKSCWYPQRHDVQFGYSYPSPEPDPPWLHQTTEYQQSKSYEPELYSHHPPLTAAYGQPLYGYELTPVYGSEPYQLGLDPTRVQQPPHYSSYTAIQSPPGTCDTNRYPTCWDTNSQHLWVEFQPLDQSGQAPFWEQPVNRAPQGYPSNDQLPTPQQPSPAPPFVLPPYAALEPPMQRSPPCDHQLLNQDPIGDDEVLLEVEEFMQVSNEKQFDLDLSYVIAKDIIYSSVEGSFTVSKVEASKEINVTFGERVIGRNELDNKWILEEGLDVSVEVSEVPNVEESEIKDDWQAINVKQPKWTNLGGRRSVPVIISGSSIAILLRQKDENEVPCTWDPGVLFNSSYSLLEAGNNRDGEAVRIYFFEFISKVYIGMQDPISRGNYEKYCHSNYRQGFQVEITLPKFLLNIIDGVSHRILKVTCEMESLTPDWQRGYKQALHDTSAQDRRTEFLSKVEDFPPQVVDAEKARESIPSQMADVSCAIEGEDDGVMVKAWVSTLKRKNQPFYTPSDAAAPPLQERDRRLGVFAEMESHLAITDRRVDSLRPPDFPEPDPPNAPPVWQQPTSGPLSGFNLPPQAQPPPVVQSLPLGRQSLHQPVIHLLGPPPWESSMFLLPGAPQPLHNLPGQCIQLILSSCDQEAPLRRSPSCRDILNHHRSAAPLPDAAASDSQHNGTMDEGVINRLKVTRIVNEVKRILIRFAFDPGGSISQNFARDRKKIEAYVQWVLKLVKIIGVEPFNANVMLSSLHLDRPKLNQAGGFVAKGAVMELDEEIFHLCSKELTEGMRLVSHRTCASIKNMFAEIWSILKLPLVGAETYCVYYGLMGANGVAVISGADLNFSGLRLMIAPAYVVPVYWQLTSMGIELLEVFHGSQISELNRLLASWFPP